MLDKPIPPHSHKHTLVWQWLQKTKPGDGELGSLVRLMRDRRDMPRSFSHKTALIKYMEKCKIDGRVIGRNAQHLYNLYVVWVQQAKHAPDGTLIESVPPSIMVRSGITRKQIAIAVLEGLGQFSQPAQQLKEGGRWAQSAYGAADAIIALFASRVNGQVLPPPPDDDDPGGGGFLSR